jgi:cardiolipin synthase
MNIPNFLTLLRILLVPILVIFLIEGKGNYAFMVFLIAGVSDGLDGFLARLLKQKTALGAILDPLADKLLLISSYITMSILGIVPSWLAVFVVSRDIIILIGIGVLELNNKPLNIKPTFDSKITTFFQLTTICFYLGYDFLEKIHFLEIYLLAATTLFTLVSGFHYITIGFKALQESPKNTDIQ